MLFLSAFPLMWVARHSAIVTQVCPCLGVGPLWAAVPQGCPCSGVGHPWATVPQWTVGYLQYLCDHLALHHAL